MLLSLPWCLTSLGYTLLWWWDQITTACCSCRSVRAPRSTLPFGRCLLPWYYVDEEIKHVTPSKSRRDVGSLQRPPFVLFGMYPGPHSKLGDEDVATFRKEYGGFCTDHLDIRIGFHDLLYTRKWELMKFIVVRLGLKVVDCLLPIRRQDVAVIADEALIYLYNRGQKCF